jgi:transcriptional regulator with XRE-family HTH domain
MAAAPLPPFVWKILCGRRLAGLRERAGMTQKQVVAPYGWSQSKLATIESGTSLAEDAFPVLRKVYKPSDEEWAEILDFLARGNETPRMEEFRNKFKGQEMRKVIDMENSASVMRSHNSMTIPGLLQSEPYMRSLFEAYIPTNSPPEVERLVELRLQRQKVLDNLDQQFSFVIDQAAFSRMDNMTGVMRDQLWHLLDVNERPNVELRIVPFSHGYYLGQAVNYSIFEYDVEPAVQVVYVESYDDVEVLPDAKKVSRYLTLWDAQAKAGLHPNEAPSVLSFLAGPRLS